MKSIIEYINENIINIFEDIEETSKNKYDAMRSIMSKYNISLYDYLFPSKDQKYSIYNTKFPIEGFNDNNEPIYKKGSKVICTSNANSLKTYLNILGKRNVSFYIKTGPNIVKGWNSGKYPEEYIRGEFGHSSTFKENIEKILGGNIVGMDDFKVDEPKINREKSSRSFLSVKVTWKDKEFYICNTDSNGKGERILIKTESVQPKALGLTSNSIEDGFNLQNNKDIERILSLITNNSKKNITIEDGIYSDFISYISKEILNSNISNYIIDKDILSKLSKNNLEIKHTINLTEKYNNIYNTLSPQDRNSLEVGFGEVLAGLLLYKYCKKEDRNSLYWPDNGSEFLNDLYFNGIGISIKSKDSKNGHRPSISSIMINIFKEIDNKDKDILNNIYQIADSFNITKQEIDEFLERMKIFYKLKKDGSGLAKTDQNRNIWKLSWSLFEDDENFKKLCNILQLKKDNWDYPEKDRALYLIDNYKNKDEIKDILIGISNKTKIKGNMDWNFISWDGLSSEKDIKNTDYYIKSGGKNKVYQENYSKIMYPLIIRCVDELNNLYSNEINNENDTSNILSILLNNYLESNQIDTEIKWNKEDKKLDIILKLYPLNKQVFKFDIAGCGPSDWNGHGTIGFVKK